MPTHWDALYLAAAFLVPLALQHWVTMPRLRAKTAAGIPHARLGTYRRTIVLQWTIVLPIAAAWIATGRPWSALWLTWPNDSWRPYVAAGILAGAIAFGAVQFRGIGRIAASAEHRAQYRGKLAGAAIIAPRDATELRWFIALSLTAGVCEEILCRGYLMWALFACLNVPLAVIAGAVIFGVEHVYQGVRGVVKTGVVGLMMIGVVWLTGSLIPAMVIHAMFNVTTGVLAYVAYSSESA
jgi:membrane protease YdiL (CAAX protease family)